METFVISDTHFNHKNVILYSNRPFKGTEDMNCKIIENWNKVVSNDDLVIFLGDFCLGNKEDIKLFASKLNGRKIIILGNHDRSAKHYLDAGFQEAKKLLIYSKGTNNCKYDIIFSHHPYLSIPSGSVNIHGHIHDKELDSKTFDLTKYFNASVENINYTPIKLKEIIEKKEW